MIEITDHVFYPISKNFKQKLARQREFTESELVQELSTLSTKYSLNSEIEEDLMVWKDENNIEQLRFYFNIKASKINRIIDVFHEVGKHSSIQNFILVNQTYRPKLTFDIFRLNQLSFLQHCNHFETQILNSGSIDLFKLNRSLYLLFGRLKPHQKYLLGKCFTTKEMFASWLEKESIKLGLNQIVNDNFVFWNNNKKATECVFLIVYDPTEIETFIQFYSLVKKKNIKIAYCIVNQIPDGNHEFDIFRISELSYLEHFNRVKPKKVIEIPD